MRHRILSAEGQPTFSVKGQMVNSLGFAGHTVSVVTTQLCCNRVKAALDNTYPRENSSRGDFLPADIWQCLEAFGIVTTRGCVTQYHKLGGLNNRNLLSYSSGG